MLLAGSPLPTAWLGSGRLQSCSQACGPLPRQTVSSLPSTRKNATKTTFHALWSCAAPDKQPLSLHINLEMLGNKFQAAQLLLYPWCRQSGAPCGAGCLPCTASLHGERKAKLLLSQPACGSASRQLTLLTSAGGDGAPSTAPSSAPRASHLGPCSKAPPEPWSLLCSLPAFLMFVPGFSVPQRCQGHH